MRKKDIRKSLHDHYNSLMQDFRNAHHGVHTQTGTSRQLDVVVKKINTLHIKEKLQTPFIHWAVEYMVQCHMTPSQIQGVLRALLNSGVDFNITRNSDSPESLLITAIRAQSLTIVEFLVEEAAVHEPLNAPVLAVPFAQEKGNTPIYQYLVKHYSQLSLGETLLTLAAYRNDMNLLQQHMSVDTIDQQNAHGFSALMVAAMFNQIAVIQCLLRQKANIQLRDQHGRTFGHLLFSSKHPKLADKVLIDQGLLHAISDNEAQDIYGHHPIHHAIAENQTQWAVQMIRRNPKLCALVTQDGASLFSYAALNGNTALLDEIKPHIDIMTEVASLLAHNLLSHKEIARWCLNQTEISLQTQFTYHHTSYIMLELLIHYRNADLIRTLNLLKQAEDITSCIDTLHQLCNEKSELSLQPSELKPLLQYIKHVITKPECSAHLQAVITHPYADFFIRLCLENQIYGINDTMAGIPLLHIIENSAYHRYFVSRDTKAYQDAIKTIVTSYPPDLTLQDTTGTTLLARLITSEDADLRIKSVTSSHIQTQSLPDMDDQNNSLLHMACRLHNMPLITWCIETLQLNMLQPNQQGETAISLTMTPLPNNITAYLFRHLDKQDKIKFLSAIQDETVVKAVIEMHFWGFQPSNAARKQLSKNPLWKAYFRPNTHPSQPPHIISEDTSATLNEDMAQLHWDTLANMMRNNQTSELKKLKSTASQTPLSPLLQEHLSEMLPLTQSMSHTSAYQFFRIPALQEFAAPIMQYIIENNQMRSLVFFLKPNTETMTNLQTTMAVEWLLCALEHEHTALFMELLKYPLIHQAASKHIHTLLLTAIEKNPEYALILLSLEHLSLPTEDNQLLLLAAQLGHADVVEALLHHNAYAALAAHDNNQALRNAIDAGDDDSCFLLLQQPCVQDALAHHNYAIVHEVLTQQNDVLLDLFKNIPHVNAYLTQLNQPSPTMTSLTDDHIPVSVSNFPVPASEISTYETQTVAQYTHTNQTVLPLHSAASAPIYSMPVTTQYAPPHSAILSSHPALSMPVYSAPVAAQYTSVNQVTLPFLPTPMPIYRPPVVFFSLPTMPVQWHSPYTVWSPVPNTLPMSVATSAQPPSLVSPSGDTTHYFDAIVMEDTQYLGNLLINNPALYSDAHFIETLLLFALRQQKSAVFLYLFNSFGAPLLMYPEKCNELLYQTLQLNLLPVFYQLLQTPGMQAHTHHMNNRLLNKAVRKQMPDAALTLLAYPNVREYAAIQNNYTLRWACSLGLSPVVSELLSIAPVLHELPAYRFSALRKAHKNGHNDIVRCLLNIPSAQAYAKRHLPQFGVYISNMYPRTTTEPVHVDANAYCRLFGTSTTTQNSDISTLHPEEGKTYG